MNTPWYQRAFRSEYLALYAHRSQDEADLQVAGLLRCGLLGRTSPLLDLACGAGRHLRAFRRAGLRAYGLDLSAELLAGQRAVVRGDMRRLPFANARFAAVTCLFTSFGYFERDDENFGVLREVFRVLQDGGVYVIDHINPAPTRSALVPHSVEHVYGATVTSRRRFDANTRRFIKEIEYSRDGRTESWHESVRAYEPDELDALLAAAGLKADRRCADSGGAPFTAHSPRQLVRAIKT